MTVYPQKMENTRKKRDYTHEKGRNSSITVLSRHSKRHTISQAFIEFLILFCFCGIVTSQGYLLNILFV